MSSSSSSRRRGRQVARHASAREGERRRSGRAGQRARVRAHLDCGGFHTTRARMRGGTPLGALDIYIAPPPLEAWGAVIQSCRASRKCAATRPTIASITLRTRRRESQVPIEPLPHRTSCQSSMHSLASGHSKKVGSDASHNGASSPTCEAQHNRPRCGGSASMLTSPDAHHAAKPKLEAVPAARGESDAAMASNAPTAKMFS